MTHDTRAEIDTERWREVTYEEFFAAMGPLNVHPRIVGPWPYVSQWTMQDGSRRIVGMSEVIPRGEGDGHRRYLPRV